MLVSGVQKSESVIQIYIYLHSFLDSFPIKAITEYWVEFPVLYSMSLLVIYFIYSSVYISHTTNECLSIHLSMDPWVTSDIWLLWIVLSSWVYKYLFETLLLILLAICIVYQLPRWLQCRWCSAYTLRIRMWGKHQLSVDANAGPHRLLCPSAVICPSIPQKDLFEPEHLVLCLEMKMPEAKL